MIFLVFQCGVQNFRRRDQCFKCAGPKTDIDASGEGADEVSPHPTNSKFQFLKYFPQTNSDQGKVSKVFFYFGHEIPSLCQHLYKYFLQPFY